MSTQATTCPFCGPPDIELVSAWGGQLITSQVRCRRCNTHFEAVREDFASDMGQAAGAGGQAAGAGGDHGPS